MLSSMQPTQNSYKVTKVLLHVQCGTITYTKMSEHLSLSKWRHVGSSKDPQATNNDLRNASRNNSSPHS